MIALYILGYVSLIFATGYALARAMAWHEDREYERAHAAQARAERAKHEEAMRALEEDNARHASELCARALAESDRP